MLKKIFYLLVLSACFTSVPSTFGQKLSPSEIRKQKQLEEEEKKKTEQNDEKNLSKREKKVQQFRDDERDEIFNDSDPEFKITTVPDKWKNESAVVIYQKMNYSYLTERGGLSSAPTALVSNELVHKRIKLLDKAAIDYFSEFYYVSSFGGDLQYRETISINIKIIKANGKSSFVNTSEAKETESEIPAFYQIYYTYSGIKYKKLAIPDLEPGDIIDYYYKTSHSFPVQLFENLFPPFLFTLSGTYPIMTQQFNFNIDRGFFINFNSYNGAPNLKDGDAGVDIKGRVKEKVKTYSLKDINREKTPKDIWNYIYRTSPTIKFQVVFTKDANGRFGRTTFVGEPGIAKNNVSADEIHTLTENFLSQYTIPDEVDQISKHLKKVMKKETDPEKIAVESYYYYRSIVLEPYYRNPLSDKDFRKKNDKVFIATLKAVFDKKEIPYQIVASVSREIGSINELLLGAELMYGIRIKNASGKYIYLFPFTTHSTVDYIDSELEGADAYAITMEKKRNEQLTFEKVKVPVSSYKQNVFTSAFNITFDDKMENLKMVKKNTIAGQFKDDNSMVALHTYDLLKEDRKRYDPEYKEEVVRGNNARLAEEKRKVDAKKDEEAERQTKALKSNIEDDYDLVSYDKFELIEAGRYSEKPELIYNETFTIKNLINKAGKNYIFDIGKIIGKQFELKEKDMIRNNDIYMSYAKTLINEVTITLPDGYKAEGLQDLSFNVDNASGTFISQAKQEGNKIIFNTKKIYKNNFDKKENWQNLTAALEAAYKFSQKKVVLKKS